MSNDMLEKSQQPKPSPRKTVVGTCRWFDTNKGFGFVTPDDGSNKDVFIHYKDIETGHLKKVTKMWKYLKQNSKVTFDIEETDKGFKAKNLNIVKE